MRNQIEVAAREKFGEPNTRLSSKNELPVRVARIEIRGAYRRRGRLLVRL